MLNRNFRYLSLAAAAWLLATPVLAQAPAAVPTDNPACLAAMQVIGHDGEAVIEMGGPIESRDDLENALNLAKIAESLVQATTQVAANDGEYCEKVVNTIPRLYPSYRDQHDHMSTGRIITVLNMLRIEVATKPRLEAEASRDISH